MVWLVVPRIAVTVSGIARAVRTVTHHAETTGTAEVTNYNDVTLCVTQCPGIGGIRCQKAQQAGSGGNKQSESINGRRGVCADVAISLSYRNSCGACASRGIADGHTKPPSRASV
jgi:hypothetical protein